MNKELQHQIILGALLHDVGKLVIRAREDSDEKDHSYWGKEWLEKYVEEGLPNVISTFAELHHSQHFNEIKKAILL